MSASDPADDIATYAARVRAELADLPSPERETLLEDLEQHLAEVTAEGEGPLEERLGPPEQYARELRAAYTAGQPRVEASSPGLAASLQEGIARLTGSNWFREIRAFLPSLRPAWWVLRAYLVVLILTAAFSPGYNLGPLPSPLTKHGLAEILATVVAIWVSVRLGRRQRPLPRPARLAAVSLNVLIGFVAVLILGNMGTLRGITVSGVVTQRTFDFATVFADGPVTNIYPYSQDGKPLTNILLYDQDGRPLTIQQGEPQTSYPIGADGKAIVNAYPLRQRHANGDPVMAPRVAFPPWPSPSPSASPSPSPSVSPTR